MAHNIGQRMHRDNAAQLLYKHFSIDGTELTLIKVCSKP